MSASTTGRWTLHLSRNVIAYLFSLREEGNEVRSAVRSLQEGIPPDASLLQQTPEEFWEWLEARHWIGFVVDHDRHWLLVTNIESATIVSPQKG